MTELSRIKKAYEAVYGLPTLERQIRLNELCGQDAQLRREIESLLAANDLDQTMFENPLFESASLVGQSLGRFHILKELGSGGMGSVYLAQDKELVQRLVAIKFVAYWGMNEQGRSRFHLEQAALARMNHPYIARLLESASTHDGQSYFVMEYLKGEPITQYCDRHMLNLVARVALFLKVCQGISHAHLKGIIHRDIKPANILIVEEQGQAVP